MKKLFLMVALSLVMVACNKEEDNEQLIGWDKIMSEVGKTDKSAVEVLYSLTEDEIWYPYNWLSYSEDKDGNIIETKYVEDGSIKYYGGGSILGYRMTNDGGVQEFNFSVVPTLGPVYYYEYNDVDIEGDNLKITYSYPSVDEIKSIALWETLAYDKDQILIKSSYEYLEPLYFPNGEIYTSDKKELYNLIQLVRYTPTNQDWKDAITEKEFDELRNK